VDLRRIIEAVRMGCEEALRKRESGEGMGS
jgi:hypothetical protein